MLSTFTGFVLSGATKATGRVENIRSPRFMAATIARMLGCHESGTTLVISVISDNATMNDPMLNQIVLLMNTLFA